MLRGALIAAALTASPAMACDCVTLIPGAPNFQADVDRIAAYYPIAAEGVIEAAGPYAWRFTVAKEYRGPGLPSYRIELVSDCSLEPSAMASLIGKPLFLLLSGGPDRYKASRCVNRQSPAVEKALRARVGADCPRR